MKKFIGILSMFSILVVSSLQTNAQVVNLTGSSYGNVLDTVTNTGTYYLTTPALKTSATGNYVIQLDAINKTGTSTITAVLQSSLDGSTWNNHFKTPGQTGVNCDTLAISGTTMHTYNILKGAVATYNTLTYYSNSGRRLYFRIKLVGGATQSTQVKAKIISSD